MSKQRVLVTYTAPPLFQSSESWKRIREALVSQLPLRNIHWKPASRPSIRTIQELYITLNPLDTTRDELVSQVPVTVLEKPLLNIYIVTCEVGRNHLLASTHLTDIFDRILILKPIGAL